MFAHADLIPDRIASAAENIGVGVVTFVNPNSSATYGRPKNCAAPKTAIMPKRRDVSTRDRRNFLAAVGLTDIG